MFGKLIVDKSEGSVRGLMNEDSLDGDHDLKEHMVGILFSRSGKLSQLQKQVIGSDIYIYDVNPETVIIVA